MSDKAANEALDSLEKEIEALENALNPILSNPLNDTLDDLTPFERAKLNSTLAFAIHNLAWMYMRTKGKDPSSHEVNTELERIQEHFIKLKKLENGPDRPNMRIDKAAVGRFVKAALGPQPETEESA